jgi:hypothetical protein
MERSPYAQNAVLWSLVVVAALSSAAPAQDLRRVARPDPGVQAAAAEAQRAILAGPNQFGTRCCQILQLPESAFHSVDATAYGSPTYFPYGYLAPMGGSVVAAVMAPVILPSGAGLDFLDLFFYDNDANADICAILYAFPASNGPPTTIATTCSSGSPGYGYASNVASGTINNDVQYTGGSHYEIWVYDFAPSGNLAFKGVDIWWHRQVSPAPAVARFNDVPTNHPFFRFVEALAASGITAGCQANPPLYCPDAPLTRKQMAAFLSAALGLYWPY